MQAKRRKAPTTAAASVSAAAPVAQVAAITIARTIAARSYHLLRKLEQAA
jgi:hypothetical protein